MLFIKTTIIFFIGWMLTCSLVYSNDYVYNHDLEIYPLHFTLRFFTLDYDRNVIGRTNTNGNILYKIVNKGNDLKLIYSFPDPIIGIWVMENGYILVSTDRDHWNPGTPCKIYLSRDNGVTFSLIKILREAGAIWWSMTSDRLNNIFIGEYGPKGINQSKRVWKSTDFGKTWEIIFVAPNVKGVHIHFVAVDPYSQKLWISYGDDKDGVLVSDDQGKTWRFVFKSQPTAILFTNDKIYLGEDELFKGMVSVYDKVKGIYKMNIFNARRFGHYAGPVYDMAMGAHKMIYVPFMKYPYLSHKPSLWVGNGSDWNLIMECPKAEGLFEGFENIAGPDKFGFIYISKYKIKDFSSLPLKNPVLIEPKNFCQLMPSNVKMAWRKIKGVDTYHLMVATDHNFKNVILNKEVKGTAYSISLPGGQRFYWRVKSIKKHIIATSWSGIFTFETLKI